MTLEIHKKGNPKLFLMGGGSPLWGEGSLHLGFLLKACTESILKCESSTGAWWKIILPFISATLALHLPEICLYITLACNTATIAGTIFFLSWQFFTFSFSFYWKVYQIDKKHFLCKDKYYGRKLSVEGFRQALHQFLHDGTRLRTELLEPIQRQLRALLLVIRNQSSYRFYSSSLLIIYDGQELPERTSEGLHPPEALQPDHGSSSGSLSKVDIRMIDFAHTTYKGSWNEHTTYDGPDPGYIFGLENLIQILQDIQEGEWGLLGLSRFFWSADIKRDLLAAGVL